MPGWLQLLFGLGDGEIPPGGVTRFELAGIPHRFWAVAAAVILVLAVALIIVLYRRETDLGAGRKAVLAGLRLFALALVVLVLLNPRIAVEIQARRPATTLVVADGSGSMAATDRFGPDEAAEISRASGLPAPLEEEPASRDDPTRADLAAAALDSTGVLPKLARSNRLRPFVFAEAAEAVEAGALPAKIRERSRQGKGTSLGSALRDALEAAGQELIAGIVVLSDGRSNGGESLAAVKGDLASRGIPVHAIGLGQVRVPKNLAIQELTVPELAEPGFPVRIRLRIRGTGLPGKVEMKLLRSRANRGPDREGEKIAGEIIELGRYSTEVVLNLTDVPPGDGRWRYRAELPVLRGEETDGDNARTAEVLVASDACRILLLSGGPSFEYRHLRNFFIRDEGIGVSCWLQSADPRFPQEGDFPIKAVPREDAGLRPYDVVVLLDPDPAALPEGFGAALEKAVTEAGAGLVLVAGEHHTADLAASPEGRRIAALLPLSIGGARPGKEHPSPWRPELTQAGAAHTLCQLLPTPPENLELWSVLPPLYFRFPAGPPKPAATTLLEAGGTPLLAVHQAGAGRVAFIGTDDLYHWREAREEIHERFWSGAARFLALGKKLAGTRKTSIVTDRERYRVGEEVLVEAHMADDDLQPVTAERVTARIEAAPETAGSGGGSAGSPAAGAREVYLEAVKGRPGWFRGRARADTAGEFRASVVDGGAGTPASFAVLPPTGEMDDVSPDLAALEDLARATGGSFGTLGSLGQLPARIPDRSLVEVLGRKAASVWDSAALLLAFAGALIIEWILRKRWRLC